MADISQINNNSSFNGNPGYILNPGARNIVVNSVKNDNNSLVSTIGMTMGTTAAGAAACWGLSKGVDYFSRSATPSKLGEIETTRFYGLINKLDGWSQHGAIKWIDTQLDNIGSGITNWHKRQVDKDGLYKSIADRRATGKETPMIANSPTHHQFMQDIAGELEKLPDDKKGQLSDIIAKLKTGKIDHKKICEALETTLDEKTINSGNIRTLINKIGLLEHVGSKERGLLARIVGKSLIKGAHFFGGSKLAIIMNGYFLAQTIKNTIVAPKGEKLKTAMEDFIGNWVGGFLMFAPIGAFVNKMANWKFIKGDTIGHKIFRGIGHVVGLGLKEKPEEVKGIWNTIVHSFKNPLETSGKLGRMALAMVVIGGLVSGAFMKLSHMIFGAPTKKKKEDKEDKVLEAMDNQNQAQQPQAQANSRYIPSATPAPNLGTGSHGDKFNRAMQASDFAMKNAQNMLQNLH